MTRTILAALALALVTLVPLPVRAEFPELLREAEGRPFWAALYLGPTVGMYRLSTQFKLTQTFGWHFAGGPTGPAVALDLSEAFGSGYVTIDMSPRFVWDIRLIEGLGVYLSPSAGVGFSYSSWSDCRPTSTGGPYCINDGWWAFHFTAAFDGKLVLGNRWLVIFRPFGLDGYADGNGSAFRYSLLVGGGAIF